MYLPVEHGAGLMLLHILRHNYEILAILVPHGTHHIPRSYIQSEHIVYGFVIRRSLRLLLILRKLDAADGIYSLLHLLLGIRQGRIVVYGHPAAIPEALLVKLAVEYLLNPSEGISAVVHKPLRPGLFAGINVYEIITYFVEAALNEKRRLNYENIYLPHLALEGDMLFYLILHGRMDNAVYKLSLFLVLKEKRRKLCRVKAACPRHDIIALKLL